MSNILTALIATLSILIVSLATKYKRRAWVYILIFFIFLFFGYTYDALYAEIIQEIRQEFPFTAKLIELSELNNTGNLKENINNQFNCRGKKKLDDQAPNTVRIIGKKCSQKQIMEDFLATAQERIDYHFDEGMRCFQEAEEICLWLPTIDDQEKAKLCFENIMAMAIPGTTNVKILAALVFSVSKYGTKVMDQWYMLSAKLCESKHHFELQEFYKDVGTYVERDLNHKIEKNKEKHDRSKK